MHMIRPAAELLQQHMHVACTLHTDPRWGAAVGGWQQLRAAGVLLALRWLCFPGSCGGRCYTALSGLTHSSGLHQSDSVRPPPLSPSSNDVIVSAGSCCRCWRPHGAARPWLSGSWSRSGQICVSLHSCFPLGQGLAVDGQAHGVEAVVNIHDVASNSGGQRGAKERSDIAHLLRDTKGWLCAS